jgi:hypothetical protein
LAFSTQTIRTGLPSVSTAAASVVLLIFVLSLMPPSYFFVAGLRLSPTRILLMATFVPLLIRLLSGAAGKLRATDVLLMLFMVWMVVTLLYHHGMERFPYAMISVVELFGGYLIGRVLVRDAADFALLFRIVFWVLLALSPFVLVELLTDRNLLQEISRKVMPTYFKGESSYGRIGLHRVMAGFEHPILYGLFCAVVFAPIMAILGARGGARYALILFLGFMTFASLSSAPLLALFIQLGLMVWAWQTGGRWWLLVGLVVSAYVVVDFLSNRTPVTILINYITFDPGTAWTRILIWDFGSAEMWRHPVFGIGMNDWTRPVWLTGSVDNFWLLNGMRHGVVGAALVVGALSCALWSVIKAAGPTGETARWRRHYVLSIIALYVSLCTVHVWGDTSAFVMLLIGAGVWFSDMPRPNSATDDRTAHHDSPVLKRRLLYSRFPAQPQRPLRGNSVGIVKSLPHGKQNHAPNR